MTPKSLQSRLKIAKNAKFGSTEDGNFAFHLSPDTLSGGTDGYATILPIGYVPGPLPLNKQVIGSAYEVRFSSANTLTKDAIVELSYHPEVVGDVDSPEIYFWNAVEHRWQHMLSNLDKTNNTITSLSSHTGVFVLLSDSATPTPETHVPSQTPTATQVPATPTSHPTVQATSVPQTPTITPSPTPTETSVVPPPHILVQDGIREGAPGSIFVIRGENFTPNQIAIILVNGISVGETMADNEGKLAFSLSSNEAASGDFKIAVKNAIITITIDASKPLHKPLPNGPLFAIPPMKDDAEDSIFLPLIQR
ncbi:hypothetical protein KFU94_14220 [Chloroflexi bacterium TSY]|nr:hypothetical protein [Chloroflexi bacterium TSY]